jgi:cytochrome o ubiquinol oxidase subunit 1
MGIYISIFAFLLAFALVWHIYWLALLGLIGTMACVIILSFDEHMEYVMSAKQVEQFERKIRE